MRLPTPGVAGGYSPNPLTGVTRRRPRGWRGMKGEGRNGKVGNGRQSGFIRIY